ncbi:MAG: hypothetical protein ACT4PT_04650 [Methanobacteriota archaeon]
MSRAFVLIDALPGREDDVFESLSKIPAVIGRRMLAQKVGNAEIIIMVEAKDQDMIEKVVSGQIRGVGGIASVRRVMTHHTIASPLRSVMEEMEKEASKKAP